ncbi:terminase small subunit [Arsukibacterium sp.]|uniref:terminase small subunit n=1 Tax=Arsukibacterium sp. TaxID=1977258 RepID=UPI002FD9F2B6
MFARSFALHGDATRARSEAGYAETKYARQEAWKLLLNQTTQKAYEHYRAKAAEKLDISENRILAEMAAMGFSNLAGYYAAGTQLKPLDELTPAQQRAIQKIKTKRYLERTGAGPEDFEEVEIMQIELHPKLPALKMIAEIKGMSAPKDADKQRPVNVHVHVTGNAEVKTDAG